MISSKSISDHNRIRSPITNFNAKNTTCDAIVFDNDAISRGKDNSSYTTLVDRISLDNTSITSNLKSISACRDNCVV